MSGKVVLSGEFGFLNLGDILQLIGSNGGSGVLRIMSKYSQEPGLIYFSKGNIIDAANGEKKGIDAAYSLFGWTEGEYEFSMGEVNVKKTITTNRMEIILDGLRMVDDGVTQKMGPVSFEKKKGGGKDKAQSLPVIKGPLVDYIYVADEEEFYDGQKIVQENSYGSWMWAILEGNVDIIKETSQGPLTIIRLGPGSYIGSISSIFQNSIRTSSAVAVGNVQLGVLDSQRLSRDFSAQSRIFRELAMNLDKRIKQINERIVEFFLKKDRTKEFLKAKKPFIKQGDQKAKFFQITQGYAAVVRKTDAGVVPIANMGMGDFIGQIPFADIGHEPNNATVLGTENFTADALDSEKIQTEYDEMEPILRNMIENIATCISMTTRTACDLYKKNLVKK